METNDSCNGPLPYGITDFDQEIVNGYYAHKPGLIDRSLDGGMVSCLRAIKGLRVPWLNKRYQDGTKFHGTPLVQLRVSPTYVYKDPLSNIIIDPQLIRDAMDGKWGKAFPDRFENENSEDAVTWNVFRTLQKANLLENLVRPWFDEVLNGDPELFLWGAEITADRGQPWERLRTLRAALEPNLDPEKGEQPTEPDIVLHFPGQVWVYIEAKFGSPHKGFSGKTLKDQERKREAWLTRRYSLVDFTKVRKADPDDPAEQLLRNIAFAHSSCEGGEQAIVVALGRQADRQEEELQRRVSEYLLADCPVTFRQATWEDLFNTLPTEPQDQKVQRLVTYMRNKTLKLRPAFQVPRG